MGFAGGGVGSRDSGVRRVDDYRGTYETVGRIEKLVDELGYRVPLRPLFFRKSNVDTAHVPPSCSPIHIGIFYATIEDSLS